MKDREFSGVEFWMEVDRVIRWRDRVLMRCYLAGLFLAGACLFFPSRLSQTGAVLLVVAFLHMMARLYAASRAGARSEAIQLWLQGMHPRLALVESMLFYLPFLVGANLLFMGIPLGVDPMREAACDCAFLTATVVLLTASYCWNMRVRRLLFGDEILCVVGRAIPPSRSE